jgi:hypothetical protein
VLESVKECGKKELKAPLSHFRFSEVGEKALEEEIVKTAHLMECGF